MSSRIAAFSSPFASYGVDGITTTSPGVCTNQASRLCECCAAMPIPLETAPRSTSGTLTWPPDMYLHFAAWLTIWSITRVTKSAICSSTTGRQPTSAAPTPAPACAASEIGASITRGGPKRSSSPSVTWKRPPSAAMSSPITNTPGSRSISSRSASLSAWAIVSSRTSTSAARRHESRPGVSHAAGA